jgi:dipeptidyl aminopeptidase/acylaminoacyl peptidase
MGPQPEIDHVAYPRAGGRLYDFEVAIFNTDNNKFNFINIGDCRDCYVNLIDWSSDGRYLYLQILDREHHHLRFLRANASDGSVHSVLEAHTQTYFDTPMTLGPVLFKLLTQGQGFLRLSERDGFRHIYHHADDGSLVRQLTTGTLPVDHIVAVDEIRGGVYYLAPADPVRPYDLNLFVVSLDGAQPQRLTPGAGHHSVELSPDLSGFLVRVSAVEFPPIVCARSIDGDYCVQVDAVDSNELGDLGFGGMETFSVPSRDGRFNLFGVIARPFGFDPARRYPVVEFIYGGMQYVHAPREFYSYGLQNGLPELRGFLETGFVVVMVDTPGTPGRGREFQDATYGVWPRGVIAEHVSWIQAAGQTRPWMDLGRVGIYGHSWGAYMAQRAVIDAPEFYRVAAGHAGPSDFCDHPTYIEPFLGLPSNNPDSYAFGSNLSRAAEIKAPVLVIGAPLDVNAGFSPSLKFVDAMVRARRDVDFFMLPETNHAFASGGDGPTAYMAAYVSRYLMSHLGVPVSEVKSLT